MRNVSGERGQSSLASKPHTVTKLPASSMSQDNADYIAKRSLGGQLSSPTTFNNGAQANR